MNLQIEIPDIQEYDTIQLDEAFDNVAYKRDISKEDLYEIYNDCKTEENFLFLNKHTLFSVNPLTVTKGDKLLYTKDNINKFVILVDIHKDNYPEIFYTIKFIDSNHEKQTVDKYLKIVEYPDFNLTHKKRKREFASYDINNSLVIASCKFLYYDHDDYFTKIYIFDNDFKKNIIISKIICEIYFQKYAKTFCKPNKCNFLVPKVYNYGFVNTNIYKDQIVFYFTMENTNCITLDKIRDVKLNNTIDNFTKYIELKYKAIGINKCLKKNGFYHNDLHSNNIMINGDNNDIFIIDYGESSKNDNNLLGFQDHKYCVNCHHEKKYCKFHF